MAFPSVGQTGQAILSWDAPTTNADGTPLADLAGYKVYNGTGTGSYTQTIDVGNALSYTVTNLTDGIIYYFAVTAYDTSGNESGFSNEVSKTIADATAPVLSAMTAGSITSSSATITWTTNEASSTQVEYGTTTSYGSQSTLNSSLVTSHSQTLSSLQAATLYHYRVKSTDAAGNTAVSGDNTFTTSSAADTTAPVISSIISSNLTENGVTISWGTDEPATTEVEFGQTSSYGNSSVMNATLLNNHTQAISGLLSGTIYHYRVKSADSAGNLSVSEDNTFTTSTTADATPPGDVLDFSAIPGALQIILSWTNPPDIDFAGVRIIFRTDRFPVSLSDGELLGDFTGNPNASTSTAHSGLQQGDTIYYIAASYDGNGNFQSTAYASATLSTTPSSNTEDQQTTLGGGCGIIIPKDGNPPGPGQVADMMALGILILIIWIKKIIKSLKSVALVLRDSWSLGLRIPINNMMVHAVIILAVILPLSAIFLSFNVQAASVQIDAKQGFQIIDGFGANFTEWAEPLNLYDIGMPVTTQQTLLDNLFKDLPLYTGIFFTQAANTETVNDNNTPTIFNWAGFNFNSDGTDMPQFFKEAKTRLAVSPNLVLVPDNIPRWLLSCSQTLSDGQCHEQNEYPDPSSVSVWLDPAKFDEYVEWGTAMVKWYRDNQGITFPYFWIANEICGSIWNSFCISASDQLTLVKKFGARFKAEGLPTKIMLGYIGGEVLTLKEIGQYFNDPEAISYVGLLAYEGNYYWDSTGPAGWDPNDLTAAQSIADLAKSRGIKVWQLSAWENISIPDESWKGGFRVAKDIYRYMAYASVSSYNYWIGLGYAPTGISTPNSGIISIYKNSAGKYDHYVLGGRYYAFKHYASYISPGSQRISASSDNASLLVTSYKDVNKGRITLVLVNDSGGNLSVNVNMSGMTAGTLTQYRSSSDTEQFINLGTLTPSGGVVSLTIPAKGVVTLTGPATFENCTSGCTDTVALTAPTKLVVK
jgi:hypothetical protein